jgi:hypothetical protein
MNKRPAGVPAGGCTEEASGLKSRRDHAVRPVLTKKGYRQPTKTRRRNTNEFVSPAGPARSRRRLPRHEPATPRSARRRPPRSASPRRPATRPNSCAPRSRASSSSRALFGGSRSASAGSVNFAHSGARGAIVEGSGLPGAGIPHSWGGLVDRKWATPLGPRREPEVLSFPRASLQTRESKCLRAIGPVHPAADRSLLRTWPQARPLLVGLMRGKEYAGRLVGELI